MNFFVCISLVYAIWSGYLFELEWLPGPSVLIAEVGSAMAAAIVVILGVRQRFIGISPLYWLLLGFIFLNMIFGIVVNTVEPGPIVAGFRLYLKAIPFFLLPAVFTFSHKQVRWQFGVLLVSGLAQFPIAFYQRIQSVGTGSLSGDYTVGTLSISSHLSMFLISIIAVLVALKARGKLPTKYFIPAIAIIALPTMINETKITLILLPLAVIIPMILTSQGKQRLKSGLGGLAMAAALVAVFIPIYDYYMMPRWGYGILDFITMEGRVEGYLDKDAGVASDRIGRIDSYVIPLQILSKDPVKLGFGLGAGNVRPSALGDRFSGRYASQYEHLVITGFSLLLWETGIFGLLIVIVFQYRILLDAFYVAKSESWYRELAAGWVFVVSIFLLGLLYKDFLANDGITFSYWYFSGLVVAEARRLQMYSQKNSVVEGRERGLQSKRYADSDAVADLPTAVRMEK